MTLTTILIVTNAVTLAALIYLLVTNNQQNGDNIVIDPQALGYGDTYKMNPQTAFELIANYTNNHLLLIDGTTGANPLATRRQQGVKGDSRSIWFPVNQLLRFVLDVKAQSGITCDPTVNTEQLGIRIYYAEYPTSQDPYWDDSASNNADGTSRRQYAGLHTLVMVPTYRNADGRDVDFDPANGSNRRDAVPFAMKEVVAAGNLAMMLNHGTMCPPPFPDQATDYYQASGAYFLDQQ